MPELRKLFRHWIRNLTEYCNDPNCPKQALPSHYIENGKFLPGMQQQLCSGVCQSSCRVLVARSFSFGAFHHASCLRSPVLPAGVCSLVTTPHAAWGYRTRCLHICGNLGACMGMSYHLSVCRKVGRPEAYVLSIEYDRVEGVTIIQEPFLPMCLPWRFGQ